MLVFLSNKIKKLFLCLTAVVLVAALAIVYCFADNSPPKKASFGNIQYSTLVRTGDEISSFAGQFGLELAAKPVFIKKIIIPETENGVFGEYLTLQKSSGLDTSKYKGRECTLLRYPIISLNDKSNILELLVLDGRVVGAIIYNEEYNSKILGLCDIAAKI